MPIWWQIWTPSHQRNRNILKKLKKIKEFYLKNLLSHFVTFCHVLSRSVTFCNVLSRYKALQSVTNGCKKRDKTWQTVTKRDKTWQNVNYNPLSSAVDIPSAIQKTAHFSNVHPGSEKEVLRYMLCHNTLRRHKFWYGVTFWTIRPMFQLI